MGRSKGGFTLIELMIVVAIIGILASIAIPEYYQVLLRSKRAELPMMVTSIRTTQWSYRAEWGEFTSAPLMPTASPGRVPTPFGVVEGDSSPWNQLGFLPDSSVYGQYQVEAIGSGGTANFLVSGYGDIDGDGVLSYYLATEQVNSEMQTPNNVY